MPSSLSLDDAVWEALGLRGWRERLRMGVVRGFTTVQVYERLPEATRVEVAGGEDSPAAARRGIDAVHRSLLGLVAAGRVTRHRERYSMLLNTKGERGMLVDLYRRA